MTLMPSVYRPRRPHASPLWQIIHHGWDDFQADYEQKYRKTHGPTSPDCIEVVEKFYRCGYLAQGFTRLQCPDCQRIQENSSFPIERQAEIAQSD